MANIVVTGGAGFIGSIIVKELVSKGHSVTVLDNLSKGKSKNLDGVPVTFVQVDLCDAEKTRDILDSAEYCFHFAAKIGGIGYFHKYPAEILRDNTLMLSNMLDAAVASKSLARFVYISSSMVFENATRFPSREEDVLSSPPPFSHYGFSKLVGEYYCRAYHEQYGLGYTIFRPFNAYGPGEIPEDEVGIAHVIPDFIKKVAFDRQYPVEVLGDGSQVRAYTYVEDLARGIVSLGFDRRTLNGDYNIANPNTFTVQELLERVWRLCGPTGKVLAVRNVKGFRDDVKRRVPSVDKALALGWKPSVDLDEGLKRTFEWIAAQRR